MDSELSNQTNNNNEIITDITEIKSLLSVFKNILEEKKKDNPKIIQAIIDYYKNEYEKYLKNSGIVNDHQKLINEYYNNLRSMRNLGFHKTHWDIYKKYGKVRYQLPGFETGSHKETVFGITKSTSQIIGLKHKDKEISKPYEVVSKVEIGKMLDNPSEIKKMIKAYTDVINKIKSNPRELIDPDAKQEIKEEQTAEYVEDAQDDTKKEEKKKILVLCATDKSIKQNKISTIINDFNKNNYDIYYIGDGILTEYIEKNIFKQNIKDISSIQQIKNKKFDIIINEYCPTFKSDDVLINISIYDDKFYDNFNKILQDKSQYITPLSDKYFESDKIKDYESEMIFIEGKSNNFYSARKYRKYTFTKKKASDETKEENKEEKTKTASDETKEASNEAEPVEKKSSILNMANISDENINKLKSGVSSTKTISFIPSKYRLNSN